MKFFIIAAFFIGLTLQHHHADIDYLYSSIYPLRAKAVLHGSTVDPVTNKSYTILGSVQFDQYVMLGNVTVTVDIFGLPPHAVSTGLWSGLHVHTYGILSVTNDIKDMCLSAGPHYNPFNVTFDSSNSTYPYVANLGNVRTWENGTIRTVYNVSGLDLYGPYTIVGRSVVLHERTDDYVLAGTDSILSGPRIACGVIGWDKSCSGSVENGFLTYYMMNINITFNETEWLDRFVSFEDPVDVNDVVETLQENEDELLKLGEKPLFKMFSNYLKSVAFKNTTSFDIKNNSWLDLGSGFNKTFHEKKDEFAELRRKLMKLV